MNNIRGYQLGLFNLKIKVITQLYPNFIILNKNLNKNFLI